MGVVAERGFSLEFVIGTALVAFGLGGALGYHNARENGPSQTACEGRGGEWFEEGIRMAGVVVHCVPVGPPRVALPAWMQPLDFDALWDSVMGEPLRLSSQHPTRFDQLWDSIEAAQVRQRP